MTLALPSFRAAQLLSHQRPFTTASDWQLSRGPSCVQVGFTEEMHLPDTSLLFPRLLLLAKILFFRISKKKKSLPFALNMSNRSHRSDLSPREQFLKDGSCHRLGPGEGLNSQGQASNHRGEAECHVKCGCLMLNFGARTPGHTQPSVLGETVDLVPLENTRACSRS